MFSHIQTHTSNKISPIDTNTHTHTHTHTHTGEESPKPTRVQQMEHIHYEALELFKKKNADYGDAFATYGVVGVLVRMGDKIHRLSSISKTGITLVNNESMRDTLMDLHNYSAMALMLLDEKKE